MVLMSICTASPSIRHVCGKILEVETETEIGIENFMANETGYGLGLDIF